METLGKISWLIPALPLAGSLLVILLLVSFNRTINRLTKPVSFFLIACLLISTSFCLVLFFLKAPEQSQDFNLIFSSIKFRFTFFLDNTIEKVVALIGSVIISILIWSLYSLERRNGYVRYFSSITAISGILFLLIIAKVIPLSLLAL